MSGAMFSEVINMQTLLQHLLGFNVATICHQDNEAVLRILASGYAAKLRHCGCVHRINVAAMSEQLASKCTTAEYCNTLEQIGFTKVIAPADWGHMRQQLGMQCVGALAARPANADKAEAFAGTQPLRLTNNHVVQLLSLLPRDSVSRGDPDAEQAHAFTVGAFVLLAFVIEPFSFLRLQHFSAGSCSSSRLHIPSQLSPCFRAWMLHSTGIPTIILLFLICWFSCLQVRVRFCGLSFLMVLYHVLRSIGI